MTSEVGVMVLEGPISEYLTLEENSYMRVSFLHLNLIVAIRQHELCLLTSPAALNNYKFLL